MLKTKAKKGTLKILVNNLYVKDVRDGTDVFLEMYITITRYGTKL